MKKKHGSVKIPEQKNSSHIKGKTSTGKKGRPLTSKLTKHKIVEMSSDEELN